MCHLRRSLLEIRCPSIFHQRPPLARSRFPSTFRTKTEIDGMRYDRILYTEDRNCISTKFQKITHFHFYRLHNTFRSMCYGQRNTGCQKSVIQTLHHWWFRCGEQSYFFLFSILFHRQQCSSCVSSINTIKKLTTKLIKHLQVWIRVWLLNYWLFWREHSTKYLVMMKEVFSAT